MAQIKLMKFGAEWCGPCGEMARKQTLEKFAKKHPDVKVEKVDLPPQELECPKCEEFGEPGEPCTQDECDGTVPDVSAAFKAAEVLAEKYDVESIPTVIIFVDGEEKARSDEAIGLRDLEALYKEAITP